jgi:hypothetical protein
VVGGCGWVCGGVGVCVGVCGRVSVCVYLLQLRNSSHVLMYCT